MAHRSFLALDKMTVESGEARTLIWNLQGLALPLMAALSFFPVLFRLQEHTFFVLLALAVGAKCRQGESPWVRTPIDVPLLLFLGWVSLTVPFSIDPWYSFGEWRKAAACVLFFYWVLLVLGEQGGRGVPPYLLWGLVAGSLAVATYGLVEFLAQGGSWHDREIRAKAPGSDSNWLGTYMVIAIPLIAAVGLSGASTWTRSLRYSGALFVALSALGASYVRAAWLAFVIEGVSLSLLTGSRKVRATFVGLCAAGGLLLAGLALYGYQTCTLAPDTLHLRLAVWTKGIESTLSSPIVGHGYGNDIFESKYADFLATGPQIRGYEWLRHLHSYFLMVTMGSGLPALLLLLWTLFIAGRELAAGIERQTDVETRYFLTGVVVMMAGFLTRNVFDYMFAGSLAYLFWLLLAVGLHCCRTPPVGGSRVPFQLFGPKEATRYGSRAGNSIQQVGTARAVPRRA